MRQGKVVVPVVVILVFLSVLPAWGQYHRVPQFTIGTLPTTPPMGAEATVTDGAAAGALLIGDGANWNCVSAKALKIIIVTCPPYNAKGDNVTDDTTAIQAALNAAPSFGTVFFPIGTYVVSATIVDSSKSLHIYGLGRQGKSDTGGLNVGSLITGSVNGFLYNVQGGSGGSPSIDGLGFRNTHATGSGIDFNTGTGGAIRNCAVNALNIGIRNNGSATPIHIDNCVVHSLGNPSGSIGILAGGAQLTSIDIVGWDEGVRMWGTAGSSLVSSRFEVNKTGLVLGKDGTGAVVGLLGFFMGGGGFEANDTAILVSSLNRGMLTGINIQGSTNAPSGSSKIGLDVRGAARVSFSNIIASGGFDDVAIRVGGGSGNQEVWSGVTAGNSIGKVWDVSASSLTDIIFENTNFTWRPDDTIAQGQTFQRHGWMTYLAQRDDLNANAEGKNLRGKNLAVTAAAVTQAVTFTGGGHSPGAAAINTATATAGAGCADGTYFYIATAVTAHGESSATSQKSVTLGSGNNQTTLTFFGNTADGFKRRIYRGTATGVYDGYYETALNSNAAFVDTCTTFDMKKTPPTTGVDPTDMREPDANYAVLCTPNWNTTCYATAKATTGFTLNFGTAAPGGGGIVDWFMVR